MSADWHSALARARAHAPFLARALDRQPELAALLSAGQGDDALAWAHRAGESAGDVAALLRRERLALATVLAIGDLAGAFTLTEVMSALTAFADRALDLAIADAIGRRVPNAEAAGFIALALGKQGAGELNYSSDIDPILLFDPDTLPRRVRDEPGEAAQHYARAVVETLTRQTGEGYVFRVDLRLRPASEVSPLAISLGAALGHYESSALAWERAAFIRARAAAGDVAAGDAFLSAIRPFVWRRSLDFGAIAEIRRLTERIRGAHTGPQVPGPGFDLKRGRGGIREIEFFAQTHQLIYGGRNPALRPRGTRAALDALALAGVIAADDAPLLGDAYDRLRTIEHRLQMIEDRQTHALPAATALEGVAALDGRRDGPALVGEVQALCAMVADRYDRLLARHGASGAHPGGGGEDELARRVSAGSTTIRALRSADARAAFETIRPDLTAALRQASDPDHALARWETLLARLPSALNLLRVFEQRPGLLDQVLRILTLAPPLADDLALHPARLDRLIDATALDLPGPIGSLSAQMAACEPGQGYEEQLDRIRRVVGEEQFALGVQLIDNRHDPIAISSGLSRVAEAALATAAAAAVAEFERAHGRVPGAELVILGLGRLGGGALTHASDLDVVYVFTGEVGSESDGPRPLTASLYFNRLAQRVTAALSAPTAAGALYQIDTRLRPQGAAGPIAVSLESFARYQREDAWAWEHMALARAHPLFGSAEARSAVAEVIAEVLSTVRDAARLRTEVLAMRGDMAAHKPATGRLDVKLMRGGLVDIEFVIHFLQLRDGVALEPNLAAALDVLATRGLVPPMLADHHRLLSRVLVAARLLAPDSEEPPACAAEALAAAARQESYPALLQAVGHARHGVAEAWADVFGEPLEIDQ